MSSHVGDCVVGVIRGGGRGNNWEVEDLLQRQVRVNDAACLGLGNHG